MTTYEDREIGRVRAAGLAGVGLALLRALGERLRAWRRRRRTMLALDRLDDRSLWDIGLTRTSTGYARLAREPGDNYHTPRGLRRP
ncbi:DUF1127 domain-containing protein [Polymorphum gilvum]|uniref:YjiS-like domain-containing protein n=1 Tax=Polymorphum gilvum (strain LMG 25793 / CGMCC 1.9160 / SL003B-26A1) TaxID=991905 RepID=F2J5I9_POLGS|nr:DUF1127 domain-containing protein [Polymorphum gilvum]ADZ72360.1 hypothetical protein SL003B_3939 [Polymorphum gilvum SL003B-26A1]